MPLFDVGAPELFPDFFHPLAWSSAEVRELAGDLGVNGEGDKDDGRVAAAISAASERLRRTGESTTNLARSAAERLLSIIEESGAEGVRLYLAAHQMAGRECLWRLLERAAKTEGDTSPLAPRAVEVEKNLWLGSAQDAVDVEFLRRERITGVFNMCGEQLLYIPGEASVREVRLCREFFREVEKDHVEWPVEYIEVSDVVDWEAHCPLSHVHRLVELVRRTRASPAGGGILVHCQAGQNRSAAVLAGALMHLEEQPSAKTVLDIVDRISEKRGGVLSNSGFRWQLLGYAALNSRLPGAPSLAAAQLSIQSALAAEIPPPRLFSGSFPAPWSPVSAGDPEVEEKLRMGDLIDDAKSRENWQRKDMDVDLIRRNEAEVQWLLEGRLPCPDILSALDRATRGKIRLLGSDDFMFRLDVDAVTCTANECLLGGGGTDAMTHTYAGPSLNAETAALPTVEGSSGEEYSFKCLTGNAVVTSGHRLPAKFIVHVVTPYLDGDGSPQRDLHIAACQSVLSFLDGEHVHSLAVGPVSTGYYGYAVCYPEPVLCPCVC
jgi:O-acetyl-ADP-ribose deacetylase (regulator of RNase III)/protein-tyrosine phosphatase